MLRLNDLSLLACPRCRAPLAHRAAALACASCAARWPIDKDGLAHLYDEARVRKRDRLLRRFYDGLPWLHEPVVRTTLPLFQDGTEAALRDAYMPRLALGALRPRDDSEPVRVLEIGIGCGANLPLLRRDLPPGLPVEIWGCDLSLGMLGVLRRRLARDPDLSAWPADRALRLLACDAHALPFRDGVFDRVFHVGAMNSYGDPRLALAEMARVAVPGTPIVVVDEQFDRNRPHNLFHRAMFRLVTFYDAHPHAPLEHLPPGARDIMVDQPSMFFYCLTFRMDP